jgi:uncharacterized protein YdcH (DUF465 family)
MLVLHADNREAIMSVLAEMERRRENLYKELQETGDFRRGIISVTYRKCGKKNCACAREGHPGHGPQHLWNTTIKGRSYAKSLKLGPEMEKYLEEIANHQRFMKLCDEIIEINERICDMRPVPEMHDDQELAALKKKLQQKFMGKYKKK